VEYRVNILKFRWDDVEYQMDFHVWDTKGKDGTTIWLFIIKRCNFSLQNLSYHETEFEPEQETA